MNFSLKRFYYQSCCEELRVLKPGGFFLWADFRLTKEMPALFNCFLDSGLEKIREKTLRILL